MDGNTIYFDILAQIWHFFLAILAKNSKNMVFGHVEKRDRESGAMLDVGSLNEVSITNLSPQEISCWALTF